MVATYCACQLLIELNRLFQMQWTHAHLGRCGVFARRLVLRIAVMITLAGGSPVGALLATVH